MQYLPKFSKLSSKKLADILKKHKVALTVSEAKKVSKLLSRTPTLTEATLWGIQGSEHCSYKSSKKYLTQLPTKAPNVILGPGEDAGIIEITKVKGERYGGAMDPLRFGSLDNKESVQVAKGVVAGIGGYGNPIGVPNLGGDAYFDEGFNGNSLVNVVSVGIVKEKDIIHSYVKKEAADEEWDIIIVGKPTDRSGMGGASFASGALEESEKEKNKGAVQEPNPFLKRHLMVSSYDLFKILQKKGLTDKVSFKDMGAGGISCSTVEQVASQNLGAKIDLGKVNTAIKNLPPEVISCAETQERFTWMCHPSITKLILDHYNKKWDLPSIADNAGAFLIGKVTHGNYELEYRGEQYVNACSTDITEGLVYDRKFKEKKKKEQEPKLKEPTDYNKTLLDLLSAENIASKKPFYETYDKQVQGQTIIEAGEADASIIAPLIDEKVPAKTKKIGIALSTDGNPRYGLISPYHGAINAVVESMRNVIAVGAYPQALTNCLNYGNPEKQDQMWELKEGIRGLIDVCKGITLKEYSDNPTPIVSGNVSLYNESKNGSIPPSAIICCVGKIDDYEKAVTSKLKSTNSNIYLIGERKDELGGSEYYKLNKKLGKSLPIVDFKQARSEMFTVADSINKKLVLSSHDISEGGLTVAVAEMAIQSENIGIEIDLDKVPNKKLRNDKKLFSETGGFILEISDENKEKFLKIAKKYKITPYLIGKTTKSTIINFKSNKKDLIKLDLEVAKDKFENALREKMNLA